MSKIDNDAYKAACKVCGIPAAYSYHRGLIEAYEAAKVGQGEDLRNLQRLFRERIKSHYDEHCGDIGAEIQDDDADSLARACISVLQAYSSKQESNTHSFVCLKDNDHVVQAIGLSREDAANKSNTRADQAASTRNDAPVSLNKAYHSEKLIELVDNHDNTYASLKEIAQCVLEAAGVRYD